MFIGSVLKGCGMGTLFVLVFPCLRENVVVICKIGSFLCSLENLLQKNLIVFFFENQFSKWRLFEKTLFLTYFSHFLVTREKLQKFLQHISHLHTVHTCILLTLLTFFTLLILKKLECLLLICVYTNAYFIVICKPRTLNNGGKDSVQYRNRKKHCFLAAAILLFIGKIIIT